MQCQLVFFMQVSDWAWLLPVSCKKNTHEKTTNTTPLCGWFILYITNHALALCIMCILIHVLLTTVG